MDPLIVPATGTPVEMGLNETDLDVFVEELADMPQLVSSDFVEYNPLIDDANYTVGKWCVRTIKKIGNCD
jgi:arginase family enzyme